MSLNYNELAKELKQTKAKIVILEEFIWKYQRIINDARKSMNYMSKKHKRAFKRLEDVFEDFEEDKDFQALKKEFYLEHLDCTRSVSTVN